MPSGNDREVLARTFIPDPDRITFPALLSLLESQSYGLRKRWEPVWNYTAIFERPGSP